MFSYQTTAQLPVNENLPEENTYSACGRSFLSAGRPRLGICQLVLLTVALATRICDRLSHTSRCFMCGRPTSETRLQDSGHPSPRFCSRDRVGMRIYAINTQAIRPSQTSDAVSRSCSVGRPGRLLFEEVLFRTGIYGVYSSRGALRVFFRHNICNRHHLTILPSRHFPVLLDRTSGTAPPG